MDRPKLSRLLAVRNPYEEDDLEDTTKTFFVRDARVHFYRCIRRSAELASWLFQYNNYSFAQKKGYSEIKIPVGTHRNPGQ